MTLVVIVEWSTVANWLWLSLGSLQVVRKVVMVCLLTRLCGLPSMLSIIRLVLSGRLSMARVNRLDPSEKQRRTSVGLMLVLCVTVCSDIPLQLTAENRASVVW